jgi:hypothetical protein
MRHKLRGITWNHFAISVWTDYESIELPFWLDDILFYNSIRGIL